MERKPLHCLAAFHPSRMASAALALALSGLLSCALQQTPAPTHCPPECNVVLISIDTLRADHLGFQGYPRDTSPNLDRFAEEALVFENAISQSAWTTPAHASMMTGLYPFEHGLVFYKNPGRLSEGTTTLAEVLGSHGYRTVSFNGGGYVSAAFGLDAGFEVYQGTRFFRHNVDSALGWLKEHGDERFFLFLHAYDVHRPYLVPEPFDLFSETEGELDPGAFCNSGTHDVKDEEELEYIVSQYDAGIRYADFVIGELLAHLQSSGLGDRTIVVVTSDHGDELFEHGACDHIKSVYEELVHVPLLIRIPGEPGRRISAQVPASVVVMPTLLELLSIDRGPLEARSAGPLLRGEEGSFRAVVSETGRGAGRHPRYWRALRTPRWKLIYHRGHSERLELYDLETDPREQLDLAHARAEIVERMRAEMFRAPIPDGLQADPAVIDPATQDSLRALGYVD